jgi:hypothetical protein
LLMADAVYVLLTVLFFLAALAYQSGCDHLR